MKTPITLKLNKDKVQIFTDRFGTLLILLAMMLLMYLLKGNRFISATNLLNIVRQQSIITLMALGVMLTIITGGTDLSGGSVISLCSCVIALLAHPVEMGSNVGQYPLVIPLVTGVLTGAVCGLVNGIFISYGNVPPFIATLGMMTAARGMALIISNSKPINGFTKTFDAIGGGNLYGIPIPVFILLIGIVIMYLILHKSKFGTYVYAIGGNEVAANVSGIGVKRNKAIVYMLAGTFTGIGAIILTSRTMAGNPSSGTGYEMDAITGAIIGGTSFSGGVGRVVNTVIGALIMGVLTNGMTIMQIDPNLQMIVKGAVIVFAVLLDQMKTRKN